MLKKTSKIFTKESLLLMSVPNILNQKYKELDQKDQIIAQKNSELAQKDAILAQKEVLIQQKDQQLLDKDNQIAFMESTNFWKLRKFYVSRRLYFFNPIFLYAKLTGYKSNNQKKPADATKANNLFYPLVTVVVPSYNHEKYLKQRLESIYAQTYKNYEVILLDDCSKDGSQTLLTKYAKKHKNTQCIFNKTNSGSVFAQWKKGIKKAKGELIWIAESDDYCENDFLEKLVRYFEDESVMLAYAKNEFVNEEGDVIEFSFDGYVSDISTSKWTESYVETAHNEVREALGIKNTIPNVSGVVFRNIPIEEFDYDILQQFKVCGDWLFYLSIIRGGRLAFESGTINYYRFHSNNTSSNYQKNIGFVKEYETVAKYISRNYKVPPLVIKKNMESVRAVWNSQNPGRENEFIKAYNIKEVRSEAENRKPNVLMGLYAFTTGGGETVPIRLANKLKDRGYAVTMFDFLATAKENQTTRQMLNKNIPVVKNINLDVNTMLDEFGIEIMHSHHTSVDVTLAQRKNKKIPHIVTTHGLYETLTKQALKNIGPAIRNVDFWVYTAKKNLAPLKSYSWFDKERVRKMINAAAPPTFTKQNITRKALGIDENAFVLCLVSRAMGSKGWREAIDAVKLANIASVNYRKIVLLLIGDGPLYVELKDKELDDNIKLLGFKENLSDYFSLADAGILPTTFPGESYPLVLIECISVHRPFIATNIGEIKSMMTLEDQSTAGEVLDLRNGSVDVLELVDSILRFSEDNVYYNTCKEVAAKLSERYSIGPIVSKYEKIYEDVISLT